MNAWNHIYDDVLHEGEIFFSELDKAKEKQESILKEILQKNSHSTFGKEYEFKDIKSIQAYQNNVPIHSYEQITEYIQLICNGEKNVLTCEDIIVFEETGGSTSGSKLIPYTSSSFHAFQKALYPWLYDLLTQHKEITHGTAYWSISPSLKNIRPSHAGIPVGLQSDADYFGEKLAINILSTLAVPPLIGAINDFTSWQYLTLRYLLKARDLTLISVWSPTFLLDLISALVEHHEIIIEDMISDKISIALPDEFCEQNLSAINVDATRITEIKNAFKEGKINTHLLWPNLNTISCWLDANAARYHEQLVTLFPKVYLQAKGLLATEGVISLPVCDSDSSILAINSGFFEFIDKEENIYLADELNIGEIYRVLITTYSGLYRYDIKDQIVVTGYQGNTPLIKFAGRTGLVSDLCGEKLTESFVLKQLNDAIDDVMLLPYVEQNTGYILLLEQEHYSEYEAVEFAVVIEQRLCNNPQYAYARKINQLAPLIPIRFNNIRKRYTHIQYNNDRLLGDIKPAVLSNDTELYTHFTSNKIQNKLRQN